MVTATEIMLVLLREMTEHASELAEWPSAVVVVAAVVATKSTLRTQNMYTYGV